MGTAKVDGAVWLNFDAWTGTPPPDAISRALRRAGVEHIRRDPTEAEYGVVFFDVAGTAAEELVRQVRASRRMLVVVVAETQRVLENGLTWHLLAAGAEDVFAWDGSPNPAQQLAARLNRWREVDRLVEGPVVAETLVGQSPSWRSVLRQIVEAARFTDAPILLTGESGTGKELVARLVHALDRPRSGGDLVVLDCTTIVPTLSGSEFFGHEKGAFTGAIAPRDGAFAMADQGTLFLDELSELPLPLQAELLRVVQEGMYKRVGSNAWRRTSFRLVAATNRDLVQEGLAGRFRRDLYYRLAGWAFQLPSLRERREDIPLLARRFLSEVRPEGPQLEMDPAVEDLLIRREYPGNIRDLRQLVGRIAARHTGPGPITVGDVPPDDRPVDVQAQLEPFPIASLVSGEADDHDPFEDAIRSALARDMTLKEITQWAGDTAVRVAYADAGGNWHQAAMRLGVTDRALQLRRATGRASAVAAAPDDG